MLTIELASRIDEVLDALHRDTDFSKTLQRISDQFAPVPDIMKSISAGGNNAASGGANLHGHFANLSRATREVSSRDFFNSLERVTLAVRSFETSFPVEPPDSAQLGEEIDSFGTLFDQFIREQTPANAVPLLLSARRLEDRLTSFIAALRLARSALDSGPALRDSGELSIILVSLLDLAGIVVALKAVNDLYEELALLLGVSINAEPLQVVKVESGSLWVRILGSSVVIGLMAQLIHESASYIYRTQTIEGQIASIPKTAEAIISVLDLSKKLEERGVNTSEINDQLRKSAVILSGDLNRLLEGQTQVLINNEPHSAALELQKRLEGPKTPRMLDHRPGEADGPLSE